MKTSRQGGTTAAGLVLCAVMAGALPGGIAFGQSSGASSPQPQVYPTPLQPIPAPPRPWGAKLPSVRQKMPYVLAPGGNNPSGRTLPPRFDPRGPGVPTPPVIQDQPSDPSSDQGTDSRPTIGVPIVHGPVFGGGTTVWRRASTGYAQGWNPPSRDYPRVDARLSIHYKPSELEAQAEADRAAALPLDERAASALAKGDIRLAHELYDELAEQRPDDLLAARTLAILEVAIGKTDPGIRRLIAIYTADPLLCDTPIDLGAFPGAEPEIRRGSSAIAAIAVRSGRADAAFTAAVLAQARGDAMVAKRFLERASKAGLDPAVAGRFEAVIAPLPARSEANPRKAE